MPTTEVETNPDLIPVLWMDNEPRNVALIKTFVEAERKHFQIHIDIVLSIDEAKNRLESGKYAALIADCKMDDFDLSVNGAEFLSEVAEGNPALPRFVYSAYLEDPRYEAAIERSSVVARASKVDERFVPPLFAHDFFKKLNYWAVRFHRVKDLSPERIEFEAYSKNPEHFTTDVNGHWDKHGGWISAVMEKRGWVWCVVVGTKIVGGSGDLNEFPNENDLVALGVKYNLIPFAYGGVTPPEELTSGPTRSKWSETKSINDWYPTLRAKLNEAEMDGDFDTGAYCTYISEVSVKKGFLNFSRTASHLGQDFRYFMKAVVVTINDSEGTSMSREITLAVVENWAATSFIDVNPARTCLFGRDLLRAFNIAVVLDSDKRVTAVRHMTNPRAACPLTDPSTGRDKCVFNF